MALAALKMEELSPSVDRSLYAAQFGSHLDRLMSIDFNVHQEAKSPIVALTKQRYFGMQQTAFEMAETYERKGATEIDWNLVDNMIGEASDLIASKLGQEAQSDHLKPLISQTIGNYENYLLYESMFENSSINPWKPTFNIIQRGLLLATSDNQDFVKEYNSKINLVQFEKNTNNLAVLVKGSRRTIGGFPLDNTYAARRLVLDYLSTEARGIDKSKSLEEIYHFLANRRLDFGNTNNVQVQVTTPLKKTGLVGSTMKGFFYINAGEDLKASFDFHNRKSKSIFQIMRRYIDRQSDFGLNLEDEADE